MARLKLLLSRLVPALAVVAALGAPALAPAPAAAEVKTSDEVFGKAASGLGLKESDLPDVAAPRAIVMSSDGEVYYERDAGSPAKIASMTKVMTCILALENCRLDETVTVDKEAAEVGESTAHLAEGDSMDLKTALRGLMTASGNDAAIAIAKHVGAKMDPASADPQSVFVKAMNEKASEIGCTDTLFENPHGLDFGRFEGKLHSTALDVAKIVRYAMRDQEFRSLAANRDTHIEVTSADGSKRGIELEAHDSFLASYEGAIGVKTGTTYEGGQCFAGAAKRDKGEFYTVVMGSPTDEDRWADTRKLMDWAYDHTVDYKLAHTDEKVGGKTVVARVSDGAWTDKTVAAGIADESASVRVFTLKGAVSVSASYEPVSGSVRKGDELGTLTYTQNGAVLARAKLVAAEDVPAPEPLEAFATFWQKLWLSLRGEQAQAPSQLVDRSS